MALGLRFFVARLHYVLQITLQLRFVFFRHCEVLFITSQLRFYLFDVVTFFCDVRITLYSGTLELCMEVTLQLRFIFVRHPYRHDPVKRESFAWDVKGYLIPAQCSTRREISKLFLCVVN